jgi:vacuolar-type H+-ATPase subunit F/Vma7
MDKTRQLFLGDASLATGFRLAGFEVFPDAGVDTLDRVLDGLLAERTPAFVVIDHDLAAAQSRRVEEVQREGGRILLTQVPPLAAPGKMMSSVDKQIALLLGMEGDQP